MIVDKQDVDMGDVLSGLTRSGRLTPADKRWISRKLDEQKRHEANLAFIAACGQNPDLPFVLMFLGGGSALVLGETLDIVGAGMDQDKRAAWYTERTANMTAEQKAEFDKLVTYLQFGETIGDYLAVFGAGIASFYIEKKTDEDLKKLYGDSNMNDITSWVQFCSKGMSTIGMGLMTFSAMILVLRAVFGNSAKDGGMASLAGLMGK